MKRFFSIISLFVLLGAGCTKGLDSATQEASQRVTLNVWGVIDDTEVYQSVLLDYQKLHPNVQLNYRRLRLEEYEKELINALAEDRGPDVFLIHNDWAGEYVPKILPMPPSTKVAYRVVTGTIKKVSTYQLQTEPTIAMKTYKEQFADVVVKDTVRLVNVSSKSDKIDLQPRIIGLPVSIDTLALYYNKDLLNAAGIPNPPENWSQFQEQVEKLTKLDAQGNIAQAGAAIGTGRNVERSTDILSALMIQNGAEMTNEQGDITFHNTPTDLQGRLDQPPSTQALQFYTDFANPTTKNYTWNLEQPDSLDAFIHGRAAFFFGYSYHLQQIRAASPKLNLGISKLPQIEGNPIKNYANYWYWVVSKKTKNPDLAWNFVQFLVKPETSQKLMDLTKRPAARKSQLSAQLNDEDVGVFASQVLTATSWYLGNDSEAMEEAFHTMIDDVVTGKNNIRDAIKFAVEKISQTMSP